MGKGGKEKKRTKNSVNFFSPSTFSFSRQTIVPKVSSSSRTFCRPLSASHHCTTCMPRSDLLPHTSLLSEVGDVLDGSVFLACFGSPRCVCSVECTGGRVRRSQTSLLHHLTPLFILPPFNFSISYSLTFLCAGIATLLLKRLR